MNTTQDLAIDTKSLSKKYKHSKEFSLHDLTIQIAHGEIYGFLGANGAGKSTMIRALLNFIQPTSGTASILGYDIVRQSMAIRRHIGYLAGDVALYNQLTARQFLDYMGQLQPVKHDSFPKQLIRDFQVELDKPIGTLSKGNRQKVGVIQALMHEPEVLILDEPTSGLDPLMQEVFFEAVRDTKKRGGSVFFSSHNLAEVQRLCDRVGFIRQGKLTKELSLAQLTKSAAHTFDITFAANPPIAELERIGKIIFKTPNQSRLSIAIAATDLSAFFAILAKHQVSQFQQREVDLEEEFLSFYREDSHD